MTGRILGAVNALRGVVLRYVVNGAGKIAPVGTRATALAKSRPAAVRHRASGERSVLAETAPIVGAVLLAMAVGVASGLWINTGLASSPFDSPPTSDQLSARTTEQALTASIRDQPDDSNVQSRVAAEVAYLTGSDKPQSAVTKSTHTDETRGGVRRAAEADTATTNARVEGASTKTVGRASGVEAKLLGGRATGRGGPCTLSTDAGAITIRGDGGSANITLKLSGTSGPAHVTAATQNWSDVVVFATSQTYGDGFDVRWYTIKSVSNRAGIYRVSFTTPCGSKSISVVVTQP